MDKFIDSRGVRITVTTATVKVQATADHPPDVAYVVQVDHQTMRQTEQGWNPNGPGWTIARPHGSELNLEHCDIRVLNGSGRTICEWKGGGKLIIVENGRMRCIACSDAKQTPGKMWLYKDKLGADVWIDCPACGGEGYVPRFKYVDPHTMAEIDYERQDRRLLLTG